MQFRMSDSTGAQIDVSGFQKVTSARVDAGFLTIDADISSSAPEISEDTEYLTADQKLAPV